MTFEEILPELKSNKVATRSNLFGAIQIVKCPDKQDRLRIWRGKNINYPYKLEAKDLLANDWKIVQSLNNQY